MRVYLNRALRPLLDVRVPDHQATKELMPFSCFLSKGLQRFERSTCFIHNQQTGLVLCDGLHEVGIT